MLDIVETLAVREAVERQTPIRRRICELLMEDHARWEIRRELGLSRGQLYRHTRAIRRSFVAMGFEEWTRPRRAKKKSSTQGAGMARPKAILHPRWRGF